MTSTKFWLGVLGVGAVTVVALAGKMDGNVALSICAVVGAPIVGNTMITKAALENGKDVNGA